MKFADYFRYDTKAEQAKELGVRGRVLKSLYKNVRIPWLLIIVGAILCGIGTLWVAPYMQAACTEFYLELVGQPTVEG